MDKTKHSKYFKSWFQSVWDYTESYLDTTAKKVRFCGILVIVELLLVYLIAVLHVGLMNLDLTISGMAEVYREPDINYPWNIFFLLTACVLFIAVLVIWKNGSPTDGRNFKLSKSDIYGSGREISQKELKKVAEVTHKDATLGTLLGQLDETGNKVVASKPGAMPNNNMLVFGPPGCGKSTSYVKTYIAQSILSRHSVIASDTKGEVYSDTVELARLHGYRVLRLDLKDPAHSNGWNVLKELRHDDVRALIFAQTVMANTGNLHDTFAAPQESLLQACCLYQERLPGLADSQRTFYNAFALLLQGADALDATITSAFNTYGECMQVVSESYATFLQGSPNLRGNIITGLANRLKILASPPIREMTSTDEIDFASIGKEPTILYISMSDQHQTMSFLSSLAFSFAFLDLVELADSNPSQKLDVPVDFMMEEFGNLGRIPNIDKYLSTARSRGISINLVVQSLAQLVGIYEESMTDTILADCATWLCLGCNDKSTADLLEWRSGEATVAVRTVQHDAMEPAIKLAHKHSTGDGRRNFYTSNDIMKIKARKEAFIVWQQMDSLKCHAFPIMQHHEYIAGHMPTVTSSSLIPLANKKAKELFRKWEDERIASFNTWMKNGGNPLRDYRGFKAKYDGPLRNEDLPDITPIHCLERMALAEAAGEKYDPTTDPDNPLCISPNTAPKTDMVAEEDVWDLTDMQFEEEDAEPDADAQQHPAGAQDTEQKEQASPVQPAEQSKAAERAKPQSTRLRAEEEQLTQQFFGGNFRTPPSKSQDERKKTVLEQNNHKKLP